MQKTSFLKIEAINKSDTKMQQIPRSDTLTNQPLKGKLRSFIYKLLSQLLLIIAFVITSLLQYWPPDKQESVLDKRNNTPIQAESQTTS